MIPGGWNVLDGIELLFIFILAVLWAVHVVGTRKKEKEYFKTVEKLMAHINFLEDEIASKSKVCKDVEDIKKKVKA